MRRILFNIVLLFASCQLIAQTSQFSGTGNWSDAARWSNGIPAATTNVTTSIGANIIVDGVAQCNNVNLFLSSLTIDIGGILTIFGTYTATTTGNNINKGTLILRGSLQPAIGTGARLTMGNSGGVTLNCGLTFSNYSIDRTP